MGDEKKGGGGFVYSRRWGHRTFQKGNFNYPITYLIRHRHWLRTLER
jgi:hypothetical protein